MKWEDYENTDWKEKLRDRLPLIGAAAAAVVVIVGFLFLLFSQTSNDLNPDGSPTDRPGQNILTAVTTTPPSTTAAPSPHEHLHGEPSEQYESDSLRVATEFVRAWANPEMQHAQWLDGLRPFLSPGTVKNYESVDPSNVPATTVTGKAEIESIGTFTASVLVPTDAGKIRVVLDNETLVNYMEPASGSRNSASRR